MKCFTFFVRQSILNMRATLLFFLSIATLCSSSQSVNVTQQNLCKSLNKVFELGIKDNFDSYDATFTKQSAFLVVPGYAIKFDEFPITYADKDNRFVAKTNLNLDSLSALKKLEELQSLVAVCLDSVKWAKWEDVNGDDASTAFLKELKQTLATSNELTLNLAITIAAPKVYSVVMYVKRRE